MYNYLHALFMGITVFFLAFAAAVLAVDQIDGVAGLVIAQVLLTPVVVGRRALVTEHQAHPARQLPHI